MATKKATRKSTAKKSSTSTKATKKVAAPKKATSPKKPSGSVRNFLDANLTLVKKVAGNPRREGSHGFESFKKIKDGMTIAQFTAKGGRLRDLHWDLQHGYVELKKA